MSLLCGSPSPSTTLLHNKHRLQRAQSSSIRHSRNKPLTNNRNNNQFVAPPGLQICFINSLTEKSEDSEVSCSTTDSDSTETEITQQCHTSTSLINPQNQVQCQKVQENQVQLHNYEPNSEDETYSDGYLASTPLTPIKTENYRPRNSSGFSKISLHSSFTGSQHTIKDHLDNDEQVESNNLLDSSSTIDALSPVAGSLLRKCARKYSQNTPFEPVLKENFLESMSLAQLKGRISILEGIVQDLNVNLVDSLMRRDELRAEQDAKMTDLEDIQSLNTVMSKETTV